MLTGAFVLSEKRLGGASPTHGDEKRQGFKAKDDAERGGGVLVFGGGEGPCHERMGEKHRGDAYDELCARRPGDAGDGP